MIDIDRGGGFLSVVRLFTDVCSATVIKMFLGIFSTFWREGLGEVLGGLDLKCRLYCIMIYDQHNSEVPFQKHCCLPKKASISPRITFSEKINIFDFTVGSVVGQMAGV